MGKVVHFEIPADDLDRAKKFYKEIFGWKINDMPEMKYIIFHTGPTEEKGMPKEAGFINGGMMQRKMIRNPVITIDVEDIEKTLKDIKTNRGKVIAEKMAVGNMGFSAYFQDCEGNIMGLWETRK